MGIHTGKEHVDATNVTKVFHKISILKYIWRFTLGWDLINAKSVVIIWNKKIMEETNPWASNINIVV